MMVERFQFTSERRKSDIILIFGPKLKSGEAGQTHLRLWSSFKTDPHLELKASKEPLGLTQQLDNNRLESVTETENGCDLFEDLKHRFLSFKKHQFEENLDHFQNLAQGQSPKAGPSETNAALEFAVNSLKVENILVIGHSCCGGIRALMSMEDEADSSSFIRSWVVVGKNARLITKSAASNLSFDQQCKHCEKESVNHSLLNLLTYPWIEEKVAKGQLSVHGGYYDFVDCTFEKWTLDFEGSNCEKSSTCSQKPTLLVLNSPKNSIPYHTE
ncbi:Carbonic anhydrase 2, chloroplastic [Morella rubra]|uniref:Carbonic anhydrase n=1 Tax=Morella rubra TaxID=262757 RepID=A0A6A1V1Z3_9ROSI|nr:Carbonic anhydrase 2, chloroplastic [Morella rubra]